MIITDDKSILVQAHQLHGNFLNSIAAALVCRPRVFCFVISMLIILVSCAAIFVGFTQWTKLSQVGIAICRLPAPVQNSDSRC